MASHPGISYGKKLSFFTAAAVFASGLGITIAACHRINSELSLHYRQATSDTASLLASRIGDELKAIVERSRFYVATADSKRFESDVDLIALSVTKKPATVTDESAEWETISQWARPSGDPASLSSQDRKELELKHPLDFDRVEQGQMDVVFGSAPNQSNFIRIAFPYGAKTETGYSQAIVAEVRADKIIASFSEARGLFAFMTNSTGRVLSATQAGHFATDEDLSKLPIIQASLQESQSGTRATHGNLDYSETPASPLQYAAFHHVSFGAPDLTVLVQAPSSLVNDVLLQVASFALVATFIFALFAGAITWFRFRGLSITALFGAKSKTQAASQAQALAQAHSNAEALQEARAQLETQATEHARELAALTDTVSAQAEARVTATAALTKFKDPEIRARLEEGKVSLSGERLQAVVLHAHLHGLERLVAAAHPVKLITLLNEFNQAVAEAVENSRGIVDHIHGGSVVAYWGVPIADNQDAECALGASRAIRKAATTLNEALAEDGHAALVLGMGMHYGPVVAGQVGSPGRLEYSAVGEAIEIASRIHTYTHQFGTDFLMTEQAAARVPATHATERVSAGDEVTPVLYELTREASEVAA
jgi:class 3 adenylate cyclase